MDGPKEVEGRTPDQGRPSTNSSHHSKQPTGANYTGHRAEQQLRCRRSASRRLAILDSGRADPQAYEPPGVIGYEDAAFHLLSMGLTPAPNLPAMRAMWAAGGESRRVAQVIAERWAS
jgi:hypothetical protein